jgi:hypothetical protein
MVVWGAFLYFSLISFFFLLHFSFFVLPSSCPDTGESEIRDRVRDREREIERNWEIRRERIWWIRELETRERTGEPVTQGRPILHGSTLATRVPTDTTGGSTIGGAWTHDP